MSDKKTWMLDTTVYENGDIIVKESKDKPVEEPDGHMTAGSSTGEAAPSNPDKAPDTSGPKE